MPFLHTPCVPHPPNSHTFYVAPKVVLDKTYIKMFQLLFLSFSLAWLPDRLWCLFKCSPFFQYFMYFCIFHRITTNQQDFKSSYWLRKNVSHSIVTLMVLCLFPLPNKPKYLSIFHSRSEIELKINREYQIDSIKENLMKYFFKSTNI